MKRLALIAFLFAAPLYATEPKKPEPVVTTRITPAKILGKAGKLVVIDAKSAKGDVLFDYDESIFDKDSVEVYGKKITLAMPAMTAQAQVFQVTMISWDDKVREKVVITLPGTDGPVPPDETTTPIQKLAAAFKAFTIEQRQFNKAIRDDVDALLKKPPVPVDAFQQAVQTAYEKDGRPMAQAQLLASIYKLSGAIVNDRNNKLGDVQAKMHVAVSLALMEPDAMKVTVLPTVRRVLADEFNRAIGGKTQDVLTDQTRALVAAEFSKAQKALEGVQP